MPLFPLLAITFGLIQLASAREGETEIPRAITLRKAVTLDAEFHGQHIGQVHLNKGDLLPVLEAEPNGFVTKIGDLDPASIKPRDIERPQPSSSSSKAAIRIPLNERRFLSKRGAPRIYPWVGNHTVFFTLTPDLDGPALEALTQYHDLGWQYYREIIGFYPKNGTLARMFEGRGTLVTVPSPKYIKAAGKGFLGWTGILLALFYSHNYEKLKTQGTPPWYHFYEMGRNYYVFADRHSLFTTGFAVAMGTLCVDQIHHTFHATKDIPAQNPDRKIRMIEEAFHKTGSNWEETFPNLNKEQGKTLTLADGTQHNMGSADLYASIVLYLFDHYGGTEWVKKFYQNLLKYPNAPLSMPGGREAQFAMMVISACSAAQANLVPFFRDRWRMPVNPALYSELEKVDWKKPESAFAWNMVPLETLPLPLAATRPDFQRQLETRNLLKNPSFETRHRHWKANGCPPSFAERLNEAAHEGRWAGQLQTTENKGQSVYQKVRLSGHKTYLFSGWLKAETLIPLSQQAGGKLRVASRASLPVTHTGRWTYVSLLVQPDRLGSLPLAVEIDNALGTLLFDNFALQEVP